MNKLIVNVVFVFSALTQIHAQCNCPSGYVVKCVSNNSLPIWGGGGSTGGRHKAVALLAMAYPFLTEDEKSKLLNVLPESESNQMMQGNLVNQNLSVTDIADLQNETKAKIVINMSQQIKAQMPSSPDSKEKQLLNTLNKLEKLVNKIEN